MIHVELIVEYDAVVTQHHSLHVGVQEFQHHLLKRLFLPSWIVLASLLKIKWLWMWTFISFFYVYLFLRERERERERMSRGGAETEGDTESEAGSRFWAVSTESDAGLKLTNREIMTWDDLWSSTDWATQVPLSIYFLDSQLYPLIFMYILMSLPLSWWL